MSEQWKFYLIIAIMVTSTILLFRMQRSLKARMFGKSPAKLAADMKAGEDLLLLDIRTPAEFAAGHIADSVNVPLDELASRLGAMKDQLADHKDTTVVLICQKGVRAFKALPQFQKRGLRQAWVLVGGLEAWTSAGLPVARG